MHEATRRTLSVLLRALDGFDTLEARTLTIAATNRKDDLDPALRSRFTASIRFGLPDSETRREILAQYAKQLDDASAAALAQATQG